MYPRRWMDAWGSVIWPRHHSWRKKEVLLFTFYFIFKQCISSLCDKNSSRRRSVCGGPSFIIFINDIVLRAHKKIVLSGLLRSSFHLFKEGDESWIFQCATERLTQPMAGKSFTASGHGNHKNLQYQLQLRIRVPHTQPTYFGFFTFGKSRLFIASHWAPGVWLCRVFFVMLMRMCT